MLKIIKENVTLDKVHFQDGWVDGQVIECLTPIALKNILYEYTHSGQVVNDRKSVAPYRATMKIDKGSLLSPKNLTHTVECVDWAWKPAIVTVMTGFYGMSMDCYILSKAYPAEGTEFLIQQGAGK